MIDSTFLDADLHNERKPEPRSKLEDFRIYGDDDNRTVHIEADLEPIDKIQPKKLIA